jgi:hypothetical protein
MGWLDWLTFEAKNGNAEALAVLRSRRIGQFKGNQVSANQAMINLMATSRMALLKTVLLNRSPKSAQSLIKQDQPPFAMTASD